MKHQTKNWHLLQIIPASAILATGMAVCAWLGGNLNTALNTTINGERHLVEKRALSSQTMPHLVDLTNMYLKAPPAISTHDDKFVIGLEKENRLSADNKKTEHKNGGLRAAIYQMPNLKQTGNKQIQTRAVII